MKKKWFYTIILVVSVNVAIFSQTSVSVPANFVGTWWSDVSKEYDVPEGVQFLTSIEIKRDSTWILSTKLKAYNQKGLEFLTEIGFTNGQVSVLSSGYVTAATSAAIVITGIGEIRPFDRFLIDGDGIVDSERRRFTKNEPQIPRQ
jgi:hypothetical protein